MKIKSYLCIILSFFLLLGCESEVIEERLYERNEFLLGTIVTVKIFDHGSEELLDEIFTKIESVELKMSKNLDDSEISYINENAGSKKVKVSKETYNVLKTAKEYSEISNGRFDISLGPIIELWDIGTENARVPNIDEINGKLKLVDYKNVELLSDNEVYLSEEGMIIDLGGIAKGYVADEVYDILKSNDVKSAIINLGGNVFVLGEKADSSPWVIGIQNPFDERGGYIGTVKVSDKSVVTSGPYERNFISDGKRYHHIFDIETGYPVENNLEGVSIVSDRSIDADALSTVLYSLGIDEGLKLVNSLDGIDCIFITKDREIILSDNADEYFELYDDNFVIINE